MHAELLAQIRAHTPLCGSWSPKLLRLPRGLLKIHISISRMLSLRFREILGDTPGVQDLLLAGCAAGCSQHRYQLSNKDSNS